MHTALIIVKMVEFVLWIWKHLFEVLHFKLFNKYFSRNLYKFTLESPVAMPVQAFCLHSQELLIHSIYSNSVSYYRPGKEVFHIFECCCCLWEYNKLVVVVKAILYERSAKFCNKLTQVAPEKRSLHILKIFIFYFPSTF